MPAVRGDASLADHARVVALPAVYDTDFGDRGHPVPRCPPALAGVVPRDVASRNAKSQCDVSMGVGETGLAVYLDFKDAINRDGRDVIEKK